MTNTQVNRRVIDLVLLDEDSNVPVEDSVVASFDKVVTEGDNQEAIQTLLLEGGVAEKITEHNKKRVEMVNMTILNNTGNTVNLQPIKIKDLTWKCTS